MSSVTDHRPTVMQPLQCDQQPLPLSATAEESSAWCRVIPIDKKGKTFCYIICFLWSIHVDPTPQRHCSWSVDMGNGKDWDEEINVFGLFIICFYKHTKMIERSSDWFYVHFHILQQDFVYLCWHFNVQPCLLIRPCSHNNSQRWIKHYVLMVTMRIGRCELLFEMKNIL